MYNHYIKTQSKSHWKNIRNNLNPSQFFFLSWRCNFFSFDSSNLYACMYMCVCVCVCLSLCMLVPYVFSPSDHVISHQSASVPVCHRLKKPCEVRSTKIWQHGDRQTLCWTENTMGDDGAPVQTRLVEHSSAVMDDHSFEKRYLINMKSIITKASLKYEFCI